MKDRVKSFARIDTPEVCCMHICTYNIYQNNEVPQISLNSVNEHSDADHDSDEDCVRFPGSGDDIDAIRARRLAELQKSVSQQGKFAGMGHGTYTEISEPEFLNSVTKSPRVVVHFYHDEFARCKAVDKNLAIVAPLIMGCRFLKINSTKCPFFVSKLGIKVLPTLIYFIMGKTVHRVVGFTELGGVDDFSIPSFIENLRMHKMLKDSDESKWKHLTSDDYSEDSDNSL